MRILLSISLLVLFSCNSKRNHETRNIERSFYYWRSVFKLSTYERQALSDLKVKTLYIKFFDVDWDGNIRSPLPVAQLRAPDSNYLRTSGLNIIPTIFISNECIFKIDPSQTTALADKILDLAKKIALNNGIGKMAEMQIDCDWTATTKAKYFAILNALKKSDNSINYSATIRLHQIKYLAKTGVPPVNRGMLMCYNMGNLTDIKTENSILETAELKKYIGDLENYPLQLDVAFPLFDWKVLFRNNKFTGLIKDLPDESLSGSAFNKTGNRYTALRDTVVNGYEIKKADLLRIEAADQQVVIDAVNAVSEKLSDKNIRVSLYHLDSLILKKYSTHEMENMYDAMH